MTGASNWIGATRDRSSKKRCRGNIRPFGENLGMGRNKINKKIIPRRNKKSKKFGWNLGRDRNRSIQSSIPRRK
jgi:hypothetical protein